MDLRKAILPRRASRIFSDAPVPSALVLALLRATGQAAGVLKQEQPWAFAVIHSRTRLADCSRRAKEHLLATGDRLFGPDPRIGSHADVTASLFHEADTVILVCAKSGLATPPEGRGLIVQNLMLAAHDLGLGSSPVGLARPWFNQAHVKAELGIPAHYEVVLPIALGHPVLPLPCHPKNEPEIACWNWDD